MPPIDVTNAPDLGDKTLTAMLDDLARIDAEHAAAYADRDAAINEKDAAPKADVATAAAALRERRDAPGPVAVRAAEDHFEAAQRRLDAAELAALQVSGEIATHISAHASSYRKALDSRLEKQRTAAREAIDVLHQTLLDVAKVDAARRWVDREGRSGTVSDFALRVPNPVDPSRVVNLNWLEVRDVLITMIEPPKPAAPDLTMRPGAPQNLPAEQFTRRRP
jgi:hypothetical protein